MNQLTNQDLFNKLKEIINNNSIEIKKEIKSINETINKKLKNLEDKYRKIEERITFLERTNRKNNIVIFGVKPRKEDLLKTTLTQVNSILQSNIAEKDINNIYSIGKKNTIVVEFISYLQKKNICQHLHKLKGTGISITNDLCPEDQKTHKTLVKHLKEARAKNQKAQIKNFKLHVNGVPYSLEELENPTEVDSDTELIHTPKPKNNSAPVTPTTKPSYLDESGEVFIESEDNSKSARKSETIKNTPTNTKISNSSYPSKAANHAVKNKETTEIRALRSRKPTS